MKKIIFLLVFTIVSNLATYKLLRFIDKRERKKLKKWEDKTLDELIKHKLELKNLPKIEEKNDI